MRFGLAVLCLCLVGGTGPAALAASPVILSADIDRTVRSNAPGLVTYDEKITVRVSDVDYATDIASVIITDSGDPPGRVRLTSGQLINNTSAVYTWVKRDLLSAPRAGSYTIEVLDRAANSDSITIGPSPGMPALHLQVIAPAMDSVIYQVPPTRLAPTFQWANPFAATERTTRIDVYEEGAQSGLWYKNIVDGSTSVLYANGGTVIGGRTQLYANHSYVWTVRSGTNAPVYERPGDAGTGYHRVIVRDWQEVHGRFTVFGDWADMPAPPALSGEFAYGTESIATLTTGNWGVTGIAGYNTDAASRVWWGPERAVDPDWSPDGRSLLYATPMGLFIDDFSGDQPVWVPGTSGADAKCRWAPDGRIIFGRSPDGGTPGLPRNYELWVASPDGTGALPVVSSNSAELCASPSPDGEWIAYDDADGSGVASVHLVHYDGSSDHELAVGGIIDQDPAYAVISLSQPAWAPDGVRLAVVFGATAAGLPELVGVGTVPVDGGDVTPLFISPYSTCCAAPQRPAWSPDDRSVVFSSGHHRPDLWDYDTIPAVELWMVAADGSLAAPVRLTEDFSLNRGISWWGMNTPAGSAVWFRRNDVRLTFDAVSAAGMTSVDEVNLPAIPGFQLLGRNHLIGTTAGHSGSISVQVYYSDGDLQPQQQEDSLVLLHRAGGEWVDITQTVDSLGNTVTGRCAELGEFALAVRTMTPPQADFSVTPTSGTAPLTVYFTDASTETATAWLWQFGDGATSTEQSPSHVYDSAGVYDVTLTASNAAGSGAPLTMAGCVTVTVAPPVAGFGVDVQSGTVPLRVQFRDGSTGDPTSWLWEFGDGETSEEQGPSHTYAAVGVYTVKLTASNAGGASTCTKADLVSVLPVPPTAAFSAEPATGCAPLQVALIDRSTGGAATSWLWDFGDGSTSGLSNPSHTYANAGSYAVSLTAANAGGSSTATSANCVTVYQFVGPLSPIDADGSAEFKKRPSVPVRFRLIAAGGVPVGSATASLLVAPVGSGGAGSYVPAESSDYLGNAFVYQPKQGYYEFPLATRAMAAGVWSLRVIVNGAVASEFRVTLSKK